MSLTGVSSRWRKEIKKYRVTRSSGRVLTSLLIAYICDVFPEKQSVDYLSTPVHWIEVYFYILFVYLIPRFAAFRHASLTMLACRSKGGSVEPGLSDAVASRYVRQSKQTYRKVSLLYSRWVRVDFRTVQYVRTPQPVLLTTPLCWYPEFSFVFGDSVHRQSNTEDFSSCPRTGLVDLPCVQGNGRLQADAVEVRISISSHWLL